MLSPPSSPPRSPRPRNLVPPPYTIRFRDSPLNPFPSSSSSLLAPHSQDNELHFRSTVPSLFEMGHYYLPISLPDDLARQQLTEEQIVVASIRRMTVMNGTVDRGRSVVRLGTTTNTNTNTATSTRTSSPSIDTPNINEHIVKQPRRNLNTSSRRERSTSASTPQRVLSIRRPACASISATDAGGSAGGGQSKRLRQSPVPLSSSQSPVTGVAVHRNSTTTTRNAAAGVVQCGSHANKFNAGQQQKGDLQHPQHQHQHHGNEKVEEEKEEQDD